ncbi:MAG: hypothetical protein V4585_05330 [Bacteroidota bacterium]
MKPIRIVMALLGLLVGSMTYGQQVFVDMPPLNQSEAKMLKSGILTYIQTYPDSTKSTIFDNLKEISQFIEIPDSTIMMSFHNIPVKVINFIEQQYYGGDIKKWNAKNDSESMMIQSDKQMYAYSIKRIVDAEEKLKNKKTFRCKYFNLLGYPCQN